jgi:predicted protein tyrosine phosphatase
MIYISSYRWMLANTAALAPRFVVSIMDPDDTMELPDGVPPANHLVLRMHDVSDIDKMYDHETSPNGDMVGRLLEFGRSWTPYTTVLVHCMSGISRSPAAVLALLAQNNPGMEDEAARALRKAAPHVRPNKLIVGIADQLLGLNGRLCESLRTMLPSVICMHDEPVELSPFPTSW